MSKEDNNLVIGKIENATKSNSYNTETDPVPKVISTGKQTSKKSYDVEKINIGTLESKLEKTRRANLLYKANEVEWYTKFNRFGVLDPQEELGPTKEYIFFVKPDLHIFDKYDDNKLNPELANVPYFMDLFKNHTNFPVLRQLQISNRVGFAQSPFMNVLSCAVKSSLDLPTANADKIETSSNMYGTKMEYMWSNYSSDEESDFSLEFSDTRFLEVYNIFKAWIEYNRLKSIGLVSPPSDDYIIEQKLHDVTCVYKIIVEDDGETIVHYSKIYGVFPLSYPRDVFGNMDKSGGLTFSIQFNGGPVEDGDPNILADFNELTANYITGKAANIYDKDYRGINGDWVGVPYIVQSATSGVNARSIFKLKWSKV